MNILNRWNLNIIFECSKETIKETVEDANLMDANLRGANLMDTNLRDANLRGADLRGANLMDANLRGADLMDADLRGADLMDADLRDADLRGANLMDANLRGVDLRGANLMDANLIQIYLPFYQVVVQKTHTRIGCKYFTNEEWVNFDDSTITKMDSTALEFWNSYKSIVFAAINSLNKGD